MPKVLIGKTLLKTLARNANEVVLEVAMMAAKALLTV
jgi:hypothetical protein